nr:CapA family protein [Bacteroidales bacterium]
MKIVIAGDYCPRFRVNELIESGSWGTILNDIKPIIQEADLSVVNLECPIVSNDAMPISKEGPNLKCVAGSVDVLKDAGFDVVTLANNHILDYGDVALENTLKVLSSRNVAYVGAGRNIQEASKVYENNIDSQKVAIINCCEHEFSIATDSIAGANPLNPIKQWYDIKTAKDNGSYVILIVHGGHEYFQYPSPRMKELYRFYVDAGADVVINHHQHCYSGYEVYKDKPIFYGLGNFCFDGNRASGSSIWNEGFIVELNIEQNKMSFKLHPYIQCKNEPTVLLMNDDESRQFFYKINRINSIISDDNRLKILFSEFMENNMKCYQSSITPYSNHWLSSLWYRGILPSFITKKRLARLKNYVECEAHRDGFMYMINKLYTK